MRTLIALMLLPLVLQAQTVCIGDSITQAKGAIGFCERLGGTNKGIGGQTAIQGLARFDDDVLAYDPKRIFIGFGANDAYHDRPVQEFRQEMREMIRLSGKKRKVILITAPPRVADYQGQTKEELNAQELKYVKVVRKLGKRYGLTVIDLFRFIKRHNVDGIHIDSLHFNDAGYELITKKIKRQLSRLSLCAT